MEPAKMTSNGQSTIPVDALLEVQKSLPGALRMNLGSRMSKVLWTW